MAEDERVRQLLDSVFEVEVGDGATARRAIPLSDDEARTLRGARACVECGADLAGADGFASTPRGPLCLDCPIEGVT